MISLRIYSKYCIESKNEYTKLDLPCNCYKSKLHICFHFKTYEVVVCRHWLKYMNDKTYFDHSFFSMNQARLSIIKTLMEEINHENVTSSSIMLQETWGLLHFNMERFYCKERDYERYPEVAKTYSMSTIRSKILDDPYYYEVAYWSKSLCVINRIHLSYFIQHCAKDTNIFYDYECDNFNSNSVKLTDMNKDNYIAHYNLIKSYIYNRNCQGQKHKEMHIVKFVQFASKFLVDKYKELKSD